MTGTSMDHAPVYVVIMAGGGGTRLWPQSRRRRPKQYLPLLPGGEALLSATVRRTLQVCPIARTLVVTTAAQVGEVRRCVPELPVDNILVEPIGRNTAPCIGLAALAALRRDPRAVLAVLPADHFVRDEYAFALALRRAVDTARQGHVVAIGVRPTRPETGYGYIQLGPAASGAEVEPPVYVGEAFVEKPDAERAEAYLKSGAYVWNGGMFFFQAQRILDELATNLPELGAILADLRQHPERTAARYPEAPAISIDYAVMERLGRRDIGDARAIRVVAGDFGWNDVGSFSAVADLHPADAQGNHVVPCPGAPAPVLINARDNLVWSSATRPVLVAAALVDHLIISVTDDAVLVLPRGRAQEVRQVVAALERDPAKDGYL